MSTKLKFHPLANLFPILEGEEADELTRDIETNGQEEKIILFDGMVLDGRNRYNSCLKLKLEPETKLFHGSPEDAIRFVWSKNGVRRHLTTSQRAAIGAEIALKLRKDAPAAPNGTAPVNTAAVAADQVGVSTRSVQAAIDIKKTSPKKFAKIKAGTATVNSVDADAKAREEKKRAQDAEAKKDEAIKRIGKVCGMSFSHAVIAGTILKADKEIIKMANLEDEDMLRIQLLVQQGWGVSKALKYKMTGLSRAHKIKDLLDRAAAQGGKFELNIEGWIVSVKKA